MGKCGEVARAELYQLAQRRWRSRIGGTCTASIGIGQETPLSVKELRRGRPVMGAIKNGRWTPITIMNRPDLPNPSRDRLVRKVRKLSLPRAGTRECLRLGIYCHLEARVREFFKRCRICAVTLVGWVSAFCAGLLNVETYLAEHRIHENSSLKHW